MTKSYVLFAAMKMDTPKTLELFYTAEIESHEAHSKEWWDPKGSMRPLHAMNKVRYNQVLKL